MLKQPARRPKRYTMKRPLLTLTLFLIYLCEASGQDSFIRQRLTQFSVRNGMSYNIILLLTLSRIHPVTYGLQQLTDSTGSTGQTSRSTGIGTMTRTALRATMSMTSSLTRKKDSGCALPQDSPIIERRPMISKESASRTQ